MFDARAYVRAVEVAASAWVRCAVKKVTEEGRLVLGVARDTVVCRRPDAPLAGIVAL
jgi:hypothetical protein